MLQFSEGDSAIVVNNALTVSDAESAVNRVEVVLAGSGSGEQLNFGDASKIEGSWSSGTLTLSAILGRRRQMLNSSLRFVRSPIRIRIHQQLTVIVRQHLQPMRIGTSLASSTAVTTFLLQRWTMMRLRWLDCQQCVAYCRI